MAKRFSFFSIPQYALVPIDGNRRPGLSNCMSRCAHELFELNSLMATAMMVDRGLGVSLVPDIVSPLTEKLNIARTWTPPFAKFSVVVIERKDCTRTFGLSMRDELAVPDGFCWSVP
ncbi:protein of unknown function (plasmid) [Caballeronia sp. S22]